MLLTERRSKQDAPPHVVIDALVNEQALWWVSVDGERRPGVVVADRPGHLTFASPFLWRPDDLIDLNIAKFGAGSQIHLRHTTDNNYHPLEASAIRHRWGEHIDRDLRDRFDCNGRAAEYEVSLYRGDVDDWTIVDRILDEIWVTIGPVPVRSPNDGRRIAKARTVVIRPGDEILAVVESAGSAG